MARRVSLRYVLTKLAGATEEFCAELSHHPSARGAGGLGSASAAAAAAAAAAPGASGGGAPAAGSLAAAASRFVQAYRASSTTRVLLAGAAMAPALNAPAAAGDPRALEALLVRLLPRASPRSVSVGDVVAFRPPAGAGAAPSASSSSSDDGDGDSGAPLHHNVMVRRVAALEQAEMVSDGAGDEPFRVPPGHCWLLADNADAAQAAAAASGAGDSGDADADANGDDAPACSAPPAADSRSFGFVPMESVLGRVVYSVRSAGDHGPVANAPSSAAGDAAVAEAEADVEALARLVRAAREQWDEAVEADADAAPSPPPPSSPAERPAGAAAPAPAADKGVADARGGDSSSSA